MSEDTINGTCNVSVWTATNDLIFPHLDLIVYSAANTLPFTLYSTAFISFVASIQVKLFGAKIVGSDVAADIEITSRQRLGGGWMQRER